MKKIIATAVILFILTGCTARENTAKQHSQNLVSVKNSSIQSVDRKTGQEISKHLVELAASTPHVHDATAVVLGRYAIVAIDVDAKLDRSKVGTLKYSVAESLMKDPHGANAFVVADPDTAQRVKEIAAEIRNGRPVQGIMNELADVTARLVPEVPGDVISPNPKRAVNDSKQQLTPGEKRNLNHKQELESNGRK